MPTIPDLTIAILTYRRPLELANCLRSITTQSYQPKKIIVVDSHILKTSIPQSRNIALKKCKTRYLAFVDDDCVLDKNWIKLAYTYLRTHPKLTYAVGQTKLLNPYHPFAKTQYRSYLSWFSAHHTLDTKNIIFDFEKIKKIRFDENLKIFEDVDFSLQLHSKGLVGQYYPKMVVHHPEVTSIFGLIKKTYVRGQYKNKIDRKWGNYDNYLPIPINIPHLFKNPLELIFSLGYLSAPLQVITIVTYPDRGANGERQTAIYNFLKRNRRIVTTLNSQELFDRITSSKRYLLVYGWTLLYYKVLKNFHDRFGINQASRIKIASMYLRAKIINRHLIKNRTSLAIISYPEDMLTTITPHRPYKTLYDSPTLYFRELELSGDLSLSAINSLKRLESKVYRLSDFVSFHWYTYFQLAKNYGIKINNPIHLNWGCASPLLLSSAPKGQVRTIHLGKLNTYWTNPPLLKKISTQIPVDFYSYETPDPSLYPHLHNFLDYLPHHDQLSKYHFGLISLSTDDLRSSGFSAKYLLYLSYGLPVLCPVWRRDPLLSPATIYYNQSNIQQVIDRYSQPKLWQKKHQAAIKLAQKLSWDNNLRPLLDIKI